MGAAALPRALATLAISLTLLPLAITPTLTLTHAHALTLVLPLVLTLALEAQTTGLLLILLTVVFLTPEIKHDLPRALTPALPHTLTDGTKIMAALSAIILDLPLATPAILTEITHAVLKEKQALK